MITKDNFIVLMDAMKEQRAIDEKATESLQDIFEDVIGGFYNNETLFSAIELFLMNEFDDIGEWILYYIYDLNWGIFWTKDTCSEKDGTVIDISTTDKLYDFLIKSMNDESV